MEYSNALIIEVSNVTFRVLFKLWNSKHNLLQLSTVDNFVKLVDLQILVKGCANTTYEATRFT